jgi:hypothetical protein
LIRLGLEKPGHGDVVGKVLDDFRQAGLGVDEREAYAGFANAHTIAVKQIAEAYPMPLDTDHVQVGG